MISLIIVNYNGKDLLQSCLESAYAQSIEEIEIIFVDNRSGDGSVEYLKEHFPHVLVIPLTKNIGFPAANNIGLKHATGDYILLLNNDATMDKDCVAHLYAAMKQDPAVGICAAKMLVAGMDITDSAGDGFSSNMKGFKRGEGSPSSAYDKEGYVFGACAGAALYRRRMIEEIGFLDEDFFLIYEDTDLNLRAQLAGWKVKYVPAAVVHHKVSSTIGCMSDIAVYYSLRNSELTRVKNIPLGIFIRCLPSYILASFLEFLFFSVRHKKLRLYCKAKRDAVRLLPKMLVKRREILKKRKVSNKYLYGMMTSIFGREFFWGKFRKFF